MRIRAVFVAMIAALLLLAVTPTLASPAEQSCGPSVFYTIVPGDNLFRISLRFGTTMDAIARANGIANYNRIFWGTTLRIPCAGTVQPPPPPPPFPYPAPPAFQPPIYIPPASDSNGVLPPVYTNPPFFIPPIVVNCNLLRGTSPLDGMNYGDNTFYWNPTPGATSYRVNVYNLDMNPVRIVASFDTPATVSRVTGHVGANAGSGFRFAWEVQAMVSDIVVCSSLRYSMFREAP